MSKTIDLAGGGVRRMTFQILEKTDRINYFFVMFLLSPFIVAGNFRQSMLYAPVPTVLFLLLVLLFLAALRKNKSGRIRPAGIKESLKRVALLIVSCLSFVFIMGLVRNDTFSPVVLWIWIGFFIVGWEIKCFMKRRRCK